MRETVEERCEHMRKVPDKEKKWAEEQFKTKGYIYYKKFGGLVNCFCGACGNSYMGVWKASEDPFEADCQHIIKPAHNKPGKCKCCGCETTYKAQGRVRPSYVAAKKKYAIGQRMGKDEFVFRVFSVEQVMSKNKKTEYDHMEYMRIFLRPGRKAQKDYYVYDPWNGVERWINHNIGGMGNIPQPDDAAISPGTWKEIAKTPMFKYVPKPDDEKARDRYFYNRQYPVMRYYEAAAKYPDFEMIVKSGMWRLTNSLVWKLGSGYRKDRATYYQRLGIYKSRVKDLIESFGDGELLEVYQLEKRAGKHWNDKEIKLVRDRLNRGSKEMGILLMIYKIASPAKVDRYLNRIMKETGCGAINEYIDYLRMRKQAGYDMTDEIVLFPRDLHRRHNEMVLEIEKEKLDKRKKEVCERFQKIAERYRKLSDKYSAAAAGYIIRPAKDAAEIVAEGRYLHHCVGGDMYLSKHNAGRSVILFLRKASEPDIPYITVEICGEKIIQWYGAYDKKPEEKYFTEWFKTYTNELIKRKDEKKTKKVVKTA